MNELLQFATPDGRPYCLRIDTALDPYHHRAALDGVFDEIPRLLWTLLEPGDVFFDVGANIGTISIPMAVKGAVVHAFEILPENVAALRAAAAATEVELAIHELAAWSSARELFAGGASAWGKIVNRGPRKVRAVALDEFCRTNKISRVDAIKLDIEGAELPALRGMQKTLSRHRPDVIFESNVHCINAQYSCNDIFLLLEDCGYGFYRFWDDHLSAFRRNDLQEIVCCDYLATVRAGEAIMNKTGFQIKEPTTEALIESILAQDRLQDVHRLYAYSVIDRAPAAVRTNARICEVVAKWEKLARASPHEVVRLRAGAASRSRWREVIRLPKWGASS